MDRTAVTGTAYRYRCTWFNASGDGPASDPSQQITLVGTPGKGAIQVIIVTE